MRLPDVFKSILSQLKITQKEFAAKTTLPLNSIRHISTGRRPRKDTLELILEHIPEMHQGALLAAWAIDALPDNYRDQIEIRIPDDDSDYTALAANTPEALVARDAIFKDLCLPTRKAVLRLKKAALHDPVIASRVRVFVDEELLKNMPVSGTACRMPKMHLPQALAITLS